MHYKTIVLELIQSRPTYHNRLCNLRKLLSTVEQFAHELKLRHEDWKTALATASPNTSPMMIASEAMERAIQELENALPNESPESDDETLTLDGALASVLQVLPSE